MAFRLKHSKSIGAQLARIVAKELRQAMRDVSARSPAEESIHEARTHVKKIRSILRLVRKALGDDYARLNECARSAAHRMATIRDADALIEEMESLRRQYRGVISPAAFRSARATLDARRQQAYARLAGRPLANIRRTLARSRRDFESSVRSAANGRAMRDGVGRGYRRARQAMRDAIAMRTDDVRLHVWRRRVKDHWYQMRLVEGFDGHVRARVRRLKRLQDWLGTYHNLVLLRAAILERPRRFGSARAVAAILGCIDKRQAALRRRSLRRGRRLFSPKPSSFRKQVGRWSA